MKIIFIRMGEFLKNIQWKQVIAAGFVSMLLLATSANLHIADASLDSDTRSQLNELENKGKVGRPRTTGQWQGEKESLEGRPGKVLERMGKEATDAAGNLADTYGQTIKDVTPGLESETLPKDE